MEDLIGKKFGLWSVIGIENNKFLICECECGTIRNVRIGDLKNGKSKSCGCISRKKTIERNLKHNLSKTKIYGRFKSMMGRCQNKNNKRYKDYGGRGIKVCNSWKENFINFYNWSLLNGFKENLTLDRIDVNGDYCPENCRWVDYEEQNRNKRNNIIVDKMCLKDWCKLNNFNYSTVYDYVRNHNLNKNPEIFYILNQYKIKREKK